MVKYALIAFCLISVQFLLAFFQINNYRKRVRELRSKGIVGIGIKKGKIKAGSIIILIANREGIIVDCEEMKGRTVFSRFNKADKYIGQDIYSLKKSYEGNKKEKNSAISQAINSIETQLSKEKGSILLEPIEQLNN